MNSYHEKLNVLDKEYKAKRKEILDLIRAHSRIDLKKDYTLKKWDGSQVHLNALFADKSDLIVIHNMGRGCPYCTLWADGFTGILHHLENRAGFVVVSPDPPEIQKPFAQSRNWNFRMLSGDGSEFTSDMGFSTEKDGKTYYLPGFSTFTKHSDGSIRRVAADFFGPGDVYAPIWHLFNHLEEGVNAWAPQFKYGD